MTTITNIQEKYLTNIQAYRKLPGFLGTLSEREQINHCRNLCRTDLYFLLRVALGRADTEHPWIFERCREVQNNPNGYLDLWAREHYKSTIITFAKSIQDILSSHGDNPLEDWNGREVTIGIFSHTRPIAKGFLRQIKQEFETNEQLVRWFPDILWAEPKKSAKKWSEDDGIVVKRSSNPNASTVEAWGLVDGQPTSKHFFIRAYDDVVTKESVGSPVMMKKTVDAWELSLNLGVQGGIERYIGTRYHSLDAYREIINREAAIKREHPGTLDGTPEGTPVYWTKQYMAEKRRKMGAYTFGCQILQNPVADKVQGFKEEWLRHYRKPGNHERMNKAIIVDPANEKKKKSDYTAMIVVGLAEDRNYYILDIVRDRLNLKERTDKLFFLHRKWSTKKSKKIKVFYEKYGKDSDIEHIEDEMDGEGYHFEIIPVGGQMDKLDRIRRLIPDFDNGRFWLPKTLMYVDYEGVSRDMVQVFIEEEYKIFPVGEHEDVFDSMARVKDKEFDVDFPKPPEHKLARPKKKKVVRLQNAGTGWMGS